MRLNSMRFLLMLFIVMPIIEMWVLISVGSSIGAFNTIALVMLTALLGIFLLRQQGFDTLWRGREKLQRGHVPAQEMIEALILAVSGALLLTPGFITDAVGFMGLIPVFRRTMIKNLIRKIKIVNGHSARSNFNQKTSDNEDIIDGESWETNNDSKSLHDK